MKIKNLILSSVVAGSALLAVGTTNAATIYGEVVEYYSDTTWGYVYVKPTNFHAVPSYVYYARTSDPELGNRLSDLLFKSGIFVTSGNCATSGSYRYCGDISYYYGY